MADEPLFDDEESFRAWLKDKPPEWARVLAGRAALRVFPLLALGWRVDPALGFIPRLILVTVRANAIAQLARLRPSYGAKKAAAIASQSVTSEAPRVNAPDFILGAFSASVTSAAGSTLSIFDTDPFDAAAQTSHFAAVATVAAFSNKLAAATIWESVNHDAVRLFRGDSPNSVDYAELWLTGVPRWHESQWVSLCELLQSDGDHWTLWIEWYQRVIRGSRSIFGLDPEGDKVVADRLVAVDEKFWEQPAEVVNRQIAAWIEEERQKAILKHRVMVSDLASPQAVATPQGKLDAQPNAEFDKPEVTSDLEELPQRQLSLIRQIIAVLQPAGGGNRFCPTGVMSALVEYRDEIAAHGVQPSIGLLRDAEEILRAEMDKPQARQEWLGEVDPQMKIFLRNHLLILDHYPLDKAREAEFARYAIDGGKALEPAFVQAMEEATHLARAAKEAGLATEEYLRVFEKRLETAKVAATLPAEKAKDSGLVRRLWLNTTGFADKSAQIIERLDKVMKTGPGKALYDGVKRLGDFLWSNIGGWS